MKQFIVGQIYSARSVCDRDCIFIFHVISRTDKTITIKSKGEIMKRRISLYDGYEYCKPFGNHSMAVILRA